MINVARGASNINVGYLLVLRVGMFDIRDTSDAVAFGAGMLVIGLFADLVRAVARG